MLLDKTCTWIFFTFRFTFSWLFFYIHSWFPFSFPSLFVLSIGRRQVGGKRWAIRLSFYFLFTYLYWKKGRKDTIVSGGDSKESWIGGGVEGKGDVYLIFFIYIGKISQTTTFLSVYFLFKFPHFSLRFSPFFGFSLVFFLSLSFFFLLWLVCLTLHFHLVYPLS